MVLQCSLELNLLLLGFLKIKNVLIEKNILILVFWIKNNNDDLNKIKIILVTVKIVYWFKFFIVMCVMIIKCEC